MHKVLDDLKKLTKSELQKIVDKNEMSPTELKNAKEAVCLLKEIDEVEVGMIHDEDMSGRDYHGSYYGDWRSERRGRNPMNGRYMSRRNRYEDSYMGDRSGHSIKDRMVDKLESMMDEASSDYEQKEIHRMIERIEMDK